MTKQNKIVTGILAGALAIAGGVLLYNRSTTSLAGIKHYPIKNFLGIDAYQWDLASHPQQGGKELRTANLQNAILSTGFTGIRLYADASVIKDDSNKTFRFSPDGRGYEQDSAISMLKRANSNISIDFCYQNMPRPIEALWQAAGKRSTQFRYPNTIPDSSATWTPLAKDFSVVAARGGHNANAPDYPLYVSPNWWEDKQVMLKGSGLYDVIEPQNELDNNWSNDFPLNGSQYAVMWKACYDAAKKVDPNITISTTGVMTEDPKILSDAIAWSKQNNSGVIPFDEYQFHCYPWGWARNIASAISPEYNMIPAAKKVVAVSQGKPCVIGEWGFDLHPESNMGVRPWSNYTGEQCRSFWITRSLLGFAATGLAKAYYYREYQDYGLANDNNSTIFTTSSLFIKDDQDNITRRLSGDVFKQLSRYGDFVWDSTLAEDSSKVVYRFSSGTKQLYVGWTIEQVQLVTINGTNRAQFTEVKLPFNFPKGTWLETQAGDTMLSKSFAGGSITLSSKPIFILVDIGGSPTPAPIPDPTPIPTPIPTPVPSTIVVKKGYYDYQNKRTYFVIYSDFRLVKTNSKYQPL